MKAIDIFNALKGKAGQHVQIAWHRTAKVLQDCPFTISKRTLAWVRSGIDYSNLESVRSGIEAGTRDEVESLPWGHWRPGFVKYIIDHTPKGQTENVEYIRLYPASFDNLAKSTVVQWFIGNQPATYAEVEPYLKADEKRKDEPAPKCFTVKADSVLPF